MRAEHAQSSTHRNSATEGVHLKLAQLVNGCRRSLCASEARGARLVRALLVFVAALTSSGAPLSPVRGDDIQAASPAAAGHEPITVAADWCTHWQQGVYDVWWIKGNCYLNQGLTYARGPEAVLWVDARGGPGQPTKVIAFFEAGAGERVAVEFKRTDGDAGKAGLLGHQQGSTWFGRLETTAPMKWKLPAAAGPPAETPAIYTRGLEQFNPDRRRQLLLAQYNEFTPAPEGLQGPPPGVRTFNIFSRSDAPMEMKTQTVNGEKAIIVSGGVRLLIEGLPTAGLPTGFGPLGVVDITTDRAVVWISDVKTGAKGEGVQSPDAPLEIYMEGNIEFRQGDRIVYANRMFYDVRRQVGVILDAELLTPLPRVDGFEYAGLVRLKAGAIRQLDATHFAANNALVTTSRLEEPAYDFSSREIVFTDGQQPVVDPISGIPLIDPYGNAVVDHQQLAESRGNVIHLRGIPVFYWPRLATDLQKPSFIIDRVKVGSDQVFGTQVLVDLDAFQLFGIRNKPQGTEWHLSTDYLSERGIGLGTDVEYDRQELFGFVGPVKGIADVWAIKDDGVDNLGLGRRDIVPEEDFRYRLFAQHRQRLQSGWEFTAESGLLSDRTFWEQYWEQEWDQRTDPRTGVRLKRLNNNRALSLEANGQVNEFFSETEFMPRLDHYWLGESLLDDRLTWFEHSQASYARFNVSTPPTNPILLGQYSVLPWESNSEGERLITRQELDLPLQAGPVKVVPFVLGELGQWGEDLNGDRLQRAYVHTGVKASLPMWATYPNVRDPMFNLNGLAHKVVFDAEFAYADSNQSYDELPLYDPLDDISIIEFRRRLFNGTLPPAISDPKFDPRSYAFRSGMQGWVTAPSAEIADDLMALRMGVRQRWQTKRGPAGNQHIIDWLTLDMNGTYFPDADRDNFGADVGLLDYDLRWHLGDRFTVVSDGAADVFGDGLKTVSGGILINRPTRGNGYVGFRSIDGPITSNVLLGSYSYRMSEKWITTAGAAYDFDNEGNIGQQFSMTRIGESMLVTLGVNVDSSKDNIGFNFLIEPRFLPNLRLTKMTGIDVPPAGAMGLE